MAYKREELDYMAAQMLPVLLEKLGLDAQGVSEVEVVNDLAGVLTLPAVKRVGGVEKVVEAPVTLLQEIALDSVKEATSNANTAATNANTATKSANAATTAANTAAGKANTATTEANTARDNANKATTAANTATTNANNAATNANTQAERAKQYGDNPPKMGDNGNWWKWDETKKAYVDTGVLAKGGVLYPTFEIDPDTLVLYMYYQDEIAADQFELDSNGVLNFKAR